MLELKVNLEDQVSSALRGFIEPRLQSRMTNFILARVGRRYRAHLRANYLAGQMINGGRGGESLSGRMRVYRDKKRKNVYLVGEKKGDQGDGQSVKLSNIYEHPGGYVITPKKKGKLMFVAGNGRVFTNMVAGRPRPFMSASMASFGWDAAFKSDSEDVIAKELKKAGLA